MLNASPRELELPIDEATVAIKIPPHSIEAEQSVLGGLMLDNQALDRVVDKLTANDFYNAGHRYIYSAISSLSNESKPFDPLTVAGLLETRGELDDVGGMLYLAELANSVPSVANIGAYAGIIFERSVLRRLISTGQKIADNAYNPEGRDSQTILDEAERLVFNIAEERPNSGGPVGVREILENTVKKIDEMFNAGNAITGTTTGFKDLDEMTSGLQASDMVIVAARPSMGKCIVAGSRVLDPETGRLVLIDEMVKNKAGTLLSLGDDFRLLPATPSAFVDDGLKPVFKVRTALGRTIETTLTHPFLSDGGWKPLGELKVGDCVAVPRILPVFGKERLAEHELKALAYFIGDGGTAESSLRFTNNNKAMMEDFAGATNAWLEQHGLLHKLAHQKMLPEIIYQLEKPSLAIFLRHLFACDGSAFAESNGQNRISYASSSEALIRGIQHLLIRFGINAKVRAKVTNYEGAQTPWELEILSQSALRIFVEEIGIFGKEERIASLKEGLVGKKSHGNQDALPESVCDYVLGLKGKSSWPDIFARAGQECPDKYNPHLVGDSRRRVSRQRAAFFAELFDDQYLRNLAVSDVYWDEIVAIEFMGEKQVYDLTVDKTHNFVADDFYVHNTTFAMNLVENALLNSDKGVMVFSLEMPAEQLMMRMLSSLGRINQSKVRSGQLEEEDWPKLLSAVERIKDKKLFIDDTAGISPSEMRSRVRRVVREHGQLGMIMIDYLQLMQIPGFGEGRTNEISEISRSLKAIAKEFNVPVIALSQLNRSLEQRPNKRPVNSDLRESGAIEQDADVIMFIYRDEVYNPDTEYKGVAEIIIGKQRNGPIGTCRLAFIGQFTRFENLAADAYGRFDDE